MITGNHIMAGMRVWPEEIHLGTYYGWVKPVADLMGDNQITLILAELQSLENFPDYKSCYDTTRNLRDTLQAFLPDARILIETEQPSFQLYTTQAMSLITGSHYNRLGPFRNAMKSEQTLGFLKALYPCMMVANILEVKPDSVLAKSGSQSPHIDVINDILQRGRQAFQWPVLKVQVLEKKHIYIPSLSGAKHMRRSEPEFCLAAVPNMGMDSIHMALKKVVTPGSSGQESLTACNIIAPIWRAATGKGEPESLKECFSRNVNCCDCVASLSHQISIDLRRVIATSQEPS